jgi:hypothetical protein
VLFAILPSYLEPHEDLCHYAYTLILPEVLQQGSASTYQSQPPRSEIELVRLPGESAVSN